MKTSKKLLSLLLFCTALGANAAEPEMPDMASDSIATQSAKKSKAKEAALNIIKDMIFSGYIIGKYSFDDREGTQSNGGFDLRLVRLNLEGDCFKDFHYRIQAEINGAPGVDKGPRIVDAFVEWQRLKYLRLKLGQFKRPFGFENPTSPLKTGVGDYSQITKKLVGMGDRCGEHSSGGRDLGFQAQGDLFPSSKDGHHWLHYQVGVFNGQGINHSDKDKHKDLIAGLWIAPTKHLAIGGFGWKGKYTYEGTATAALPKSAKRNRWGVGLKYEDKWTARAEYMYSYGGKVNKADAATHADGWYALVGTPSMKGFRIYGKWDAYRDSYSWASLVQKYCLTASYHLGKHLIFQVNYALNDDRTQALGSNRYYNYFDLQVYASF